MADRAIQDIRVAWRVVAFNPLNWLSAAPIDMQRIAIYSFSDTGQTHYFVPGDPNSPGTTITASFVGAYTPKTWWTYANDGPVVNQQFWTTAASAGSVFIYEVFDDNLQQEQYSGRIILPGQATRNGMSTSDAYRRLSKLLTTLKREWHDIR